MGKTERHLRRRLAPLAEGKSHSQLDNRRAASRQALALLPQA